MQTDLECLVCFVRQALSAARLSTRDPQIQRRVIDETGRMLSRVNVKDTPPENAVFLYRLIAEITGKQDPFKELKHQSNVFALSLYDSINSQVEAATDPLRTAIHFAACGNIIDYAAQHSFDAAESMAGCSSRSFLVDDYSALVEQIRAVRQPKVLYLADNCGEIVFDSIAIRELQKIGCDVTLAVRGAPIINDATMEDAVFCGLTSVCRVIDNGTGCPGTPLGDCSEEFRRCFGEADVILSKGMGNFETLSDVDAPLFFLFTVKCSRVASYLNDLFTGRELGLTGRGEMMFLHKPA
ncbi:MAG TPA: DUF89 family protein [Desulfobulbaceae bacterium]|nr:DUF89 family protein [Desulfobulbaceae bacterium]